MFKLSLFIVKFHVIVLLLSSCKVVVYKFSGDKSSSSYILQKKNKFEFYIPAASYSGTFDVMDENDNLDSVIKKYDVVPYEGVSYFKNIFINEKMLCIQNNKAKDSLLFVSDIFQFNKQAVFSKDFFPILSFSNQTRKLNLYIGEYDVKYIGDSLCSFYNHPPIKIKLLDFYPNNPRVDSNLYHSPVRIGFSSENGVPLYMEYYIYLADPTKLYFQCTDYCVFHGSKRTLKKILMF